MLAQGTWRIICFESKQGTQLSSSRKCKNPKTSKRAKRSIEDNTEDRVKNLSIKHHTQSPNEGLGCGLHYLCFIIPSFYGLQ